MIIDPVSSSGNRDNDFEIVIGIVAPIGTDLDDLFRRLEKELDHYSYSSKMIRLSQLLSNDRLSGTYDHGLPLEEDADCTAERLMNRGDALREKYESGDALAAVAIKEIVATRELLNLESNQTSRHAWILRTLKHETEVELLRHVYGGRFILISAQQNEGTRAGKLKMDLMDELPDAGNVEELSARLISRDQWDGQTRFGQRVRETYAMADYFLNLDHDIDQEVSRLVGLLFGKAFITPTRDEQSMFHAYAAALRSADSGRQVGASITTPEGDLIVTGTNEVPTAGGGNYWPGDSGDKRDFVHGYDFNKKMSERAIKEFVQFLQRNSLLSEELLAKDLPEIYTLLSEVEDKGIKRLRLMSLIEFGRVSHAEMSAITQAARSTASTEGAHIFTTAFPCHMCMRLIIGSGISRVVYIDPYPKSLAFDMYRDSLIDSERMEVTPFWGVSWTVYAKLFTMINRDKDDSGKFGFGSGKPYRMRLAGHQPLAGAETREKAVVAVVGAPNGPSRLR